MKTKYLGLALAGLAAIGTAGIMDRSPQRGLVVHEWGTFTSLQGSDGVPLRWNPLESSRLPKFVYDWRSPGLGRYPSGMLALGPKSALVSLQRMETPVIYFYSTEEQTVDVSVRFPKGGITEWYPQAPQIGPSSVRAGPLVTKLDSGLHNCGVSPSFSLGSIFDGEVKESLIRWPVVRVLPAASHPEAAQLLLKDSSRSHYFAARDTDSAYVQCAAHCPTNSQVQSEKFLFYRGVGNFSTPLVVQMNTERGITVANHGQGKLSHLFILNIRGGVGKYLYLAGLKPGEQKELSLDEVQQSVPVAELRREVGTRMARALNAEGLYPREATAMVNTWDDSWFREEGARVLYILPRTWTDETLPMRIDPKPKELVRVMVGRAELITPETERKLTDDLTQARDGRSEAPQEIQAMVKSLGRFAEPIFSQALARTDATPSERDALWTLFYRGRR